ncbi:MAG: ABC transporter permease [Candidatus Nanopelagicales bacterium]
MTTKDLTAALSVELLKLRRSHVPLTTFVVFTVAPLAGALLVFVASDPQRARDLGLVGTKAQLSGITPDWPGLLMFATQVAVAGSLLVFSFILTWLFGREFVDRTAHYLMALPVPRSAIVAAKFAVFAGWGALLAAWLALVTLGIGSAMRLPSWSATLAAGAVSAIVRACLLTLLTAAPIAYVASRTRGFLSPLAAAIGLMVLAQLAAGLGWGAALPWSIPALAAGVAPDQHAGAGSLMIVALTGVVGCWATLRWWQGPNAGL